MLLSGSFFVYNASVFSFLLLYNYIKAFAASRTAHRVRTLDTGQAQHAFTPRAGLVDMCLSVAQLVFCKGEKALDAREESNEFSVFFASFVNIS